jgi:gliding motility-associated-like protein
MLIAIDSSGCPDTALNTVIIDREYTIYTPNSFTPNGDEINDYFLPKGFGIYGEGFRFYIYNRWGDLLYETSGIFKDYEEAVAEIGWDGRANFGKKIAQQEVYVWLMVTVDSKTKRHEYVGHVTLLR